MNQQYTSDSIKVLKGLEAVRVRPGMYIGNTDDGSGLHHMIYEVTDNSVDEALAGHCKKINIIIHSDGSISVDDDGRGIPVDIHSEEKVSAAQVIMTQLHAGGKFDQDTYKISGGLHGVGVSVVNALSEWLELVIIRNGKYYFMRFKKGDTEAPLQEINLEDYQTLGVKDYPILDYLKNKKSGTYIRFTPDLTIFTTVTDFSFDILRNRYKELSFLNPNLTFSLEEISTKKQEIFYDEGGVKNFVLLNAKNKKLLFEKPFDCGGEKNGIYVDIALIWAADSYSENLLCFTNNIPQKEGGTHLQGFKTGLTKAVQKYIPENKLKGLECTSDDIREGLFAVISVKVPNPSFASQTKEKLVSREVRPVVEGIITESLERWLEENPQITKIIVERILESIRVRDASRRARELTRKHKSLDSGLSVAGKFADCSLKDPAVRELFLAEGQSAGGTAKMARDRRIKQFLHCKVKFLMWEKAILSKILQYEALKILVGVIGSGVGETCTAEDSKFHKIIIMTDADVDGSHIRTLLLTFFLRYMRPLVDAGFIYVSWPPLYAIKNKKDPAKYLKNDQELTNYIISNTAKSINIFKNNIVLENHEKEEFYYNSFLVKADLAQFKELQKDFVESGAVFLQDNAVELLEKSLAQKYNNVNIVKTDAKWEISFDKYAKKVCYVLQVENISDIVKNFLQNWVPVLVKIHSKEHNIKDIFAFNDLIADLQNNLFEISRFKGLGEMNPKELRDTGIAPNTRIIEQVTYADLEQADYITKLLMGDDVPLRRKFIEDNALNANVDA